VHRLQIQHNYGALLTIPPSYILVHAVVWACGEERQTDTYTVTYTHIDGRDHYTFCHLQLMQNVTNGKWLDVPTACPNYSTNLRHFVYDSTKFCVNTGQLSYSDVTVWDLQCGMITHIAYSTQRVLQIQSFLHLNYFRGHFKENVTAKLLLHLKRLHSRKFQ